MADENKKPFGKAKTKDEMPDSALDKVAGGDRGKSNSSGYSSDPEDQYGKHERG